MFSPEVLRKTYFHSLCLVFTVIPKLKWWWHCYSDHGDKKSYIYSQTATAQWAVVLLLLLFCCCLDSSSDWANVFLQTCFRKENKMCVEEGGGKGERQGCWAKGGGGVLNRTVNTISNLIVTVDYVLGMKNVTILFGWYKNYKGASHNSQSLMTMQPSFKRYLVILLDKQMNMWPSKRVGKVQYFILPSLERYLVILFDKKKMNRWASMTLMKSTILYSTIQHTLFYHLRRDMVILNHPQKDISLISK